MGRVPLVLKKVRATSKRRERGGQPNAKDGRRRHDLNQ
jgi:hypothetical protein